MVHFVLTLTNSYALNILKIMHMFDIAKCDKYPLIAIDDINNEIEEIFSRLSHLHAIISYDCFLSNSFGDEFKQNVKTFAKFCKQNNIPTKNIFGIRKSKIPSDDLFVQLYSDADPKVFDERFDIVDKCFEQTGLKVSIM